MTFLRTGQSQLSSAFMAAATTPNSFSTRFVHLTAVLVRKPMRSGLEIWRNTDHVEHNGVSDDASSCQCQSTPEHTGCTSSDSPRSLERMPAKL